MQCSVYFIKEKDGLLCETVTNQNENVWLQNMPGDLNMFADYFVSEYESVPWQNKAIDLTN